jgi:hypothetical protein
LKKIKSDYEQALKEHMKIYEEIELFAYKDSNHISKFLFFLKKTNYISYKNIKQNKHLKILKKSPNNKKNKNIANKNRNFRKSNR